MFIRKQKSVARLRSQVEELRTKLEQARAMVNRKHEAIERLNERLANLKVSASVDPLLHNSREGMDQFFAEELEEQTYREFGVELRKQLAERNVRFDGRRVADFGVGPGIVLGEVLAGSSPAKVLGADFSERALGHARSRLPDAEIVQWDLYDQHPDRFDVVICTEVLEHLEYPAKALSNLMQVVDRGGVLVLTVPNGRLDRSHYHVNFWSPESWKIFLDDVVVRGREARWSVTLGAFGVREDDLPRVNLAILTSQG